MVRFLSLLLLDMCACVVSVVMWSNLGCLRDCLGTLCGCGRCCDCDVCTVVCVAGVACVYAERVRGYDGQGRSMGQGRCGSGECWV